jgi:hypothetical protein
VEVLAVQVSVAECATGCTPVPERLIVTVEALLEIVTLPVEVMAVAGVNVTVRLAVWPAVSVRPEDSPLMLKPLPATATLEMFTLELPVLLMTTDNWLLLPIVTVLKLRLPGFAESTNVAATPVPLSGIVVFGELESLLARTTFPVTLPAD